MTNEHGTYATNVGRLKILQWTKEQDYPWDEWTSHCAMKNGHLYVSKWVHKQGHLCDEWEYFYVGKGGHTNKAACVTVGYITLQ